MILKMVATAKQCGHDSNRSRLFSQYERDGTWRKLTDELGISNQSYVYNYVVHGIVPGNTEIRNRLGITSKDLEYTRTRNERLNQAAQAAGWKHLSEYLTAVNNDMAEIPERRKIATFPFSTVAP